MPKTVSWHIQFIKLLIFFPKKSNSLLKGINVNGNDRNSIACPSGKSMSDCFTCFKRLVGTTHFPNDQIYKRMGSYTLFGLLVLNTIMVQFCIKCVLLLKVK